MGNTCNLLLLVVGMLGLGLQGTGEFDLSEQQHKSLPQLNRKNHSLSFPTTFPIIKKKDLMALGACENLHHIWVGRTKYIHIGVES